MCVAWGVPERCDLAPTLVREERTDEFLAQWVRFSGEPGERVPGLFVRPLRSAGRLPVIIVLPGGHRTKDFALFGHEQWPLPFDLKTVAQATNRILVLRNGRVVEQGGIVETMSRPSHPYTSQLVSAFDDARRGTGEEFRPSNGTLPRLQYED